MSDEEKEFMDTMEYIFRAPIIEHPMSSFPEPMAADHILYRLLEGTKCFEEKTATGYEALGYLSACSLVGPLGTNLTDVMNHLFNKYFPSQAMNTEDPRVANLTPDAARELQQLRRWLFKKQAAHIKEMNKRHRDVPAEQLRRAQHTLEDFK